MSNGWLELYPCSPIGSGGCGARNLGMHKTQSLTARNSRSHESTLLYAIPILSHGWRRIRDFLPIRDVIRNIVRSLKGAIVKMRNQALCENSLGQGQRHNQ